MLWTTSLQPASHLLFNPFDQHDVIDKMDQYDAPYDF